MMKYLVLLFCVASMTNISAQKEVFFKLNHLLEKEKFEMNKSVQNNIGTTFTFKRVDYYISNITLYHDGVSTILSDLYILVRDGNTINESLGIHSLTNLDSISFTIGVDEARNHLDPAQYKADHALAPKSPDMHWGWASGYKFVAIEGLNGDNLENEYQVHALGDALLKKVTLKTSGVVDNNKLILDINANYAKAFDDININKTVFIHGSNKEAPNVMKNFSEKVFTIAEKSSSISEKIIKPLHVNENPSVRSEIKIIFDELPLQNSILTVYDTQGKVIKTLEDIQLENNIFIEPSGVYFIILTQNGISTHSTKVIRL